MFQALQNYSKDPILSKIFCAAGKLKKQQINTQTLMKKEFKSKIVKMKTKKTFFCIKLIETTNLIFGFLKQERRKPSYLDSACSSETRASFVAADLD